MAVREHLAILGALAGIFTLAPPVLAGSPPSSSEELQQAVQVENVVRHLRALQSVADRSGGSRATGTVGYERSLDYAESVLRRAGYRVSRQPYEFFGFLLNGPSVLRRWSGSSVVELDHNVMTYSGSGQVNAALTSPAGSSFGCDPGDFDGHNAGTIVLVGRGNCAFAAKADNAYAAGAAGLIISNNRPATTLQGVLATPTDADFIPFTADLPVLGISRELGDQLAAELAGDVILEIEVDTTRRTITAENLLAESCAGDPDEVVLAGAHIDSVGANPGINGNGSGVALLLEIARQMSDVRPTNQLRFAFWSGEEGLWGSTRYVASLSQEERRQIALYLNVELVGASNAVRFVLDGDGSASPGTVPAPPGSEAIEQLFREHFASRGLPSEELPFADRGADYSPFVAAGVDIPSGGVAAASDGVKTDTQAALYGGSAGSHYDLCYHQRCDTIANIDRPTLDQMSDAVAHALMTYAFDTSSLPSAARAPRAEKSDTAPTAPRSFWGAPSQ